MRQATVETRSQDEPTKRKETKDQKAVWGWQCEKGAGEWKVMSGWLKSRKKKLRRWLESRGKKMSGWLGSREEKVTGWLGGREKEVKGQCECYRNASVFNNMCLSCNTVILLEECSNVQYLSCNNSYNQGPEKKSQGLKEMEAN
jgi:hypothetical protein